jgi:uncharacterized protein HemX
MTKCPVEDCKDMEGIREKVEFMERDMVRRSTVHWVIGLCVLILVAICGAVWNSAVDARKERENNKQLITANSVKQDTLVQSMKEDITEMKQDQKEFQRNVIQAVKGIREEIRGLSK